MIKIEYITPESHHSYTPTRKVVFEVEHEDATVDEMLEMYRNFLNAIGYYVDNIVMDNDYKNN